MNKSRVLIGALLVAMITVPAFMFIDPLDMNPIGNLDDSQENRNSELLLLPPDFSLTNDYQLTWEANQIRGSTHSIALTDDKALMAAGGGYLSDNTLHIYRWDNATTSYYHIWDSGDQIIANDVLSVEFADTDNNGLLEVIAGCADGRVYMFEQQGYEGSATANFFDYVWDSGDTLTKQVWTVATDDLDSDGLKEVVAGCWDNKVHVFEYEWHSGWPHCEEHLIDMTKVWDTGDAIDTRVLSVATGDTDNDGLRELIAGSYDGKLHIFEFLPCGVHRYEKIWDSGDLMFNPIVSITLSNSLDEDPYGEIAVSSYGQGVFTIEYDPVTESYTSMELMQPVATWEEGLLPNTGVYSGYELDPYADKKIYGWEEQGVLELEDPIPYPWSIPEIGGNSSLPGPRDSNYTTFQPRDDYSYMGHLGVGGEAPGEVAYPTSIAFDSTGNIFVVDKGNHRIQKFSIDGEYITHWGGFGTGDGYFADPHGITIGSDNHVYVTDSANHRIQKFTTTGAFNASWGSYGSNDDEFISPEGIAIDDFGYLYVSDTGNNRVKQINSTTGEVIDIWTGFDTPRGIAVNFNDFIFIVDSHHHQVQIYNYTGEYLGAWGQFGADADTFVDPRGIAIDPEGHVFITDYSLDQIKKFTWWGTFIGYWGSTGIDPGEFYHPEGVAIGPQKYVYIADSGVNRTQLFALETYQLLNNWEHEDLEITMGSACDSSDNLYVTDYYNGTIKKFSPSGLLIDILSVNGSEPGELFQPWGIAVDSNDDLYVSEIGNHRISKFTSEGTFILTWGTLGSSSSEFNNPVGVALDSANNVYIADMYNNRIQKFNSQGDFIMEWGSTGSGEGEFSAPAGIDIDSNDVVYVADYLNHRIQFFSNTGTFSDSFSVTGPVDIAIDESCHIYTNTPPYTSIMKYTTDGVLITELEGRIAGYNITTDLHKASTIALDNHGTLYASGEHQVMKIQPGVVHTNVAEVILDFGKYEEISGMGNSNNDLDITMPYVTPFPNFMNMEFAISQDGETFVTLPTSLSTFAMKPPRLHLGFDVDPVLQENNWKSFRYLKIGVKHGVTYRIDAVWGVLARPIPTALSLTIGHVRTPITLPSDKHIIIGTVDGSILAYTSGGGQIWYSYGDLPRFSLESSIRDIEYLGIRGRLPTWNLINSFADGTEFSLPVNFSRFMGYSLVDVAGSSARDLVVTVTGFHASSGHVTWILLLQNIGTDQNPNFSYQPGYFSGRIDGITEDYIDGFALATAVDLTNDGAPELVTTAIGKPDVYLTYYENDGTNQWTIGAGIIQVPSSVIADKGNLSKVAFHDMNGNGLLDLTVSSGKLYYFPNTGSLTSPLFGSYDATFYADINEAIGEHAVGGQVAFSDFDSDGDFDITLPLSGGIINRGMGGLMPNSSRLSYFENTGSLHDPVWEQRRTFYQPDFMGTALSPERGYIDPHFVDLNNDGVLDLVLMRNESIDLFAGSLQHNCFLVATYPFIHQVEVDKRSSMWGFDAFDSWDNRREFEHWTYSITIADTDDDGIDEVIVGSYDSNIYAFEHVFNNTYRRAWRSPDMTHQETSIVWDDVIDLVVGDQDQDGNEEIIAATDSRVVIFENIGNDQYTTVWDSLNPDDLNWTLSDIRAITVDNDLDGDGESEIVIACDKGAYVIENLANDDYEIVWWWYAPGTPDMGLFVRTVTTGDPDNDGNREIILGLTNETHLSSGEVLVFESMIRIFENTDDNLFGDYSWTDRSELYSARVHSVILADHDSDGYAEIMIGSDNGICLLERIADNQYGYLIHYSTPEPTYCLVAGNTDHDTWNEIIAGIGNNFTVFELNPLFSRSSHIYDIVWATSELPERATDVVIGDTNGNNATEIVGTIAGGYTYCYDWLPNATELASLHEAPVAPDQSMNIRGQSCPSAPMITGVALQRKNGGIIS